MDIAQQELTEEETLFGLYDDTHHNGSIGTAAGSVGSACSAFDFYSNSYDYRVSKKSSSSLMVSNKNINNNINNNSKHMLNDTSSVGDFFMEDELNLSDPTKSSWRHDIVPIPMASRPVLGPVRSGPYLDMSYHPTPKHRGRSKAVPIGVAFSMPESSHHLNQYSTSQLAKQK